MINGYRFIVKNDTVTSRGYVPKGAVGIVTNPGHINKVRFKPYIIGNTRTTMEECLSDNQINTIDSAS